MSSSAETSRRLRAVASAAHISSGGTLTYRYDRRDNPTPQAGGDMPIDSRGGQTVADPKPTSAPPVPNVPPVSVPVPVSVPGPVPAIAPIPQGPRSPPDLPRPAQPTPQPDLPVSTPARPTDTTERPGQAIPGDNSSASSLGRQERPTPSSAGGESASGSRSGKYGKFPERVTDSEERMKNRYGITDREWREGMHDVKSSIEGNPDVKFGVKSGKIYDAKSGELIGNVKECKDDWSSDDEDDEEG